MEEFMTTKKETAKSFPYFCCWIRSNCYPKSGKEKLGSGLLTFRSAQQFLSLILVFSISYCQVVKFNKNC